jgi:homocysteine S-methyltransferase
MSGLHPFLERLARGPILCDGAMGTQLYERGITFEHCFEELNVGNPELVKQIHLDYIAAGAEIIETNTFGANRVRLAGCGFEHQVRAFNRAGAKLAREARDLSGQQVFIAGSIGPLGRALAPLGPLTPEEAREAFREQAEALLQAGVDLFIVETISDTAELRAALLAVRGVTDLPLVAQMTFNEEGMARDGEDVATVTRLMRDLGADVVGVNCALGPADTLAVVQRMAGTGEQLIVSAQPNAGLPRRIDSRFIYMSTPEYFAHYTERFLAAGVTLIGGCCGTTPQHIAAMAAVLRAAHPVSTPPVPAPPAHLRVVGDPGSTDSRVPAATEMATRLASGKWLVSAEMRPPRGIKFTRFLQNATYLRDCGADTINITDNAMAHVRMSNIAAARLIQEQVGIETIVHFTPRDRNLMAVQSDLIGAHASGLRNVLAVTGDPPNQGDFPHATGIWDVDSIGLIAILHNINAGRDAMGNALGTPGSFFIGCAATPTATDIDRDLERLQRKIQAGAHFIMTQPVFEPGALLAYLDRYRTRFGPIPIPILVGIQPLHSYRLAEKFHNEVPGIVIPETVLDRMRRAGEHGYREGLAISKELIAALFPLVQGAYIMPLDRYDLVGELVPYIRSLEPAHPSTQESSSP